MNYDNRTGKAFGLEHKTIIELEIDKIPLPEKTLVVIAMDTKIDNEEIINFLNRMGIAEYIFYNEEISEKMFI